MHYIMLNKQISLTMDYYIMNLLEKNNIREVKIEETALKAIRSLKPRLGLETKKKFEYLVYQTFKINLLTLKKSEIVLYGDLNFKLEDRYIYLFETDFRKKR